MSESNKPFYCALCNKGYSQQPQWASHESSYEHTHALRRRDLQSQTAVKAKAARAAADDNAGGNMRRLDATGAPLGEARGFKKGTFKKSSFRAVVPVGNSNGDGDGANAAKQSLTPASTTTGTTSTDAQTVPESTATNTAPAAPPEPQPARPPTEIPLPSITYAIDNADVPRYNPLHPTNCDAACTHELPWAGRNGDYALRRREGLSVNKGTFVPSGRTLDFTDDDDEANADARSGAGGVWRAPASSLDAQRAGGASDRRMYDYE